MKTIKTIKFGKILETTLFKLFNLLILAVPYSEFIKEDGILQFDKTNRDSNSSHIKKMSISLQLLGLLRCPVVTFDIKTNKYIILDGQHLFKGSRETKQSEIYCIVYNGKDKSAAMRTLNNTQKPWALLEYVKQSVKEGKKDYIILAEALKGKIVTSSVLPMIFSLKSRKDVSADIKSGEFKIVNKKANETINAIKNCYSSNNTLPKTRQYQEKLVLLILNTEKFSIGLFIANLCRATVEDLGNDESGIANQLKAIYEGTYLRVAA